MKRNTITLLLLLGLLMGRMAFGGFASPVAAADGSVVMDDDDGGDNDDDGVIPEAEDEFEPDPIAVCTLTLLFSVDNYAVSSQKHATNPTFVHPPAIRSPNH